MARIDLDIWEASPENPRMIKYVGQRTAQEVFEELRHRLESTGYLPDEYFLLSHEWENGKEIPKDADIFCTTDFGASEGIYLDIYLKWYDEQQKKSVTQNFATGKTLGESGSDMDRMFLIASAVTKAFHSDGVHARYIRLGEAEQSEGAVMHLNGNERRLLIDSLMDSRNRLKHETQDVERLLRRVTGSITEFVNEVGERPLKISDYDTAVLAIQDGNPSALFEAHQHVPGKTGELLVQAAGRPGTVGRKMTGMLLVAAKDIPNDVYLSACKNAIATGDTERVLMMALSAEDSVADLDMGLYGKMIKHAFNEHMHQIAGSLLNQCTPEQIKAADPGLLPQALYAREYQMAMKLAEKGADGNYCAAEVIHALISHGNNRGYFKHFLERGMLVDNNNYSAMQACIKTDSAEIGKLLLDRGMDFDRFAEWAESQGYAENDGEAFSAIKVYWENEIKQQDAGSEPEPEQTGGMTMGGM